MKNNILTVLFLIFPLAPSIAADMPITLWEKDDYSQAGGGALVENSAEGNILFLPKPGAYVSRKFNLKSEWRVINLKGAMKVTNVPRGKESWQTGRFAMQWFDAHGKTVTPWPMNYGWIGTTDWMKVDHNYIIPTNAAKLSISLCNLAPGGEVRFKDISMAVVRNKTTKPGNVPLPKGVPDNAESLDDAWSAASPSHSRWSMNGLWRCRPSLEGEPDGFVPKSNDNWSWAQVPDVWRIWDKNPFGPQTCLAPWFEDHPEDMARIRPDRAWYARTFKMPVSAAGRRVTLSFDMVASRAIVYLDGKRAGETSFPGGEVDLTPLIKPGGEQTLSIDVTAYAEGDTLVYNEARRSDKVKKTVTFRGITGDMWLDAAPLGTRIIDAWSETSLSQGEARFVAEIKGADNGAKFRMKAKVAKLDGTQSKEFAGDCTAGSTGLVAFTVPWKDAAVWDLHTPSNRYSCTLSLQDAAGNVIDESVPFTFGFREVKISGRDLLLNGTPVHLRALHDASPTTIGFAMSREGGLAFCRNVAAYGFNSFIGGNYSFGAGAVTYLQGILDACDEMGMLYCFTLPHFKDFGDLNKPEAQRLYRETTAKIMRLARRHPSVAMWATSHNAAGYLAAGDPLLIDGIYEYGGNKQKREYAHICRSIIGELDSTRPCYHHESGNLDDFHCVNCYLDWAPIQERSDWLEHWSTKGVKPLFFVEWGLPHISTWSSYRGPLFIWRKPGYMSLWSAEYAAAYRNDAAFEATPEIRAALDAEEELWQTPEAFSWSRLTRHCSAISNNYFAIQGLFASDNWRSFRGWGITAVLPWDQSGMCERSFTSKDSPNPEWPAKLKQPGYCPRTLGTRWADPAEYTPTALGRAMKRWNMPLCAWIGGRDSASAIPENTFTDKRHIFRQGDVVEKTLMAVNDRRVPTTLSWKVSCADYSKDGKVTILPGAQARVPISFTLPSEPGEHTLHAEFRFSDGSIQTDTLPLHVRAPAPSPRSAVALFDAVGDTSSLFKRLGISFKQIDLPTLLSVTNTPDVRNQRIVVGRNSLSRDVFRNAILPIAQYGGSVLIFEQTKETLEDVGFRVQTIGLRHVYPRFSEKSLADVLSETNLRDWAGASTLAPAYYSHTDHEYYRGGTGSALWAGYRNTRVWRCGNRGAVATVVPEKPTCGDWCALVDGGFNLEYSPLLVWRLANTGKIIFCQMDVTARTTTDPAADDLSRSLVAFLSERPPSDMIAKPYGMQAYASILYSTHGPWTLEQDPTKDTKRLYFITSGATPPDGFFENVQAGATALLCGLTADEVRRFCPVPVSVVDTNHCHYARIERLPPELNGLSNADWAWHGAMDFAAFINSVPDGNNAFRVIRHGKGRLVFWQLPPWKIDAENRPYLRATKRRADAMFSRLKGNLNFKRNVNPYIFYADIPAAEDDPYRYYHW